MRLPVVSRRPDPEIARDAVATIQMELPYSYEHIKVVVKEGWVTLEGEVEWHYQRERAEDAVQRLTGVKGISNLIRIKPKIVPADIKHKIEEAFRRSAEIDANRITVEANGGKITLKGTVRSWAERQEAERVAWSAPGVTKVDNRITVSHVRPSATVGWTGAAGLRRSPRRRGRLKPSREGLPRDHGGAPSLPRDLRALAGPGCSQPPGAVLNAGPKGESQRGLS